MDFLQYVFEYFSAGFYTVLVFAFFGLGVALIGFVAESGVRNVLVGIFGIGVFVGLMFACIGLGTYFAEYTGIPVLIGIAGGFALFYGLAVFGDWIVDKIQESKKRRLQQATRAEHTSITDSRESEVSKAVNQAMTKPGFRPSKHGLLDDD